MGPLTGNAVIHMIVRTMALQSFFLAGGGGVPGKAYVEPVRLFGDVFPAVDDAGDSMKAFLQTGRAGDLGHRRSQHPGPGRPAPASWVDTPDGLCTAVPDSPRLASARSAGSRPALS
jgi:hypothetical protein